jgi:hypothetical protein
MDEFEMNYIFNELDTILELIHANFIVRNVQRHILISTAIKTLTLENVYERFVLEVKSRNIPDYLFMQYSLKIRSLDWYNLYWKSDKRISRICEMVQRVINYDTMQTQTKQ